MTRAASSLRTRLTIGIVSLAAVVFVVVALVTIRLTTEQLRDRLDERVLSDGATVRTLVRGAIERERDGRPPPAEPPAWTADLFVTVVADGEVTSLGPLVARPYMPAASISPTRARSLLGRVDTVHIDSGPTIRATAIEYANLGIVVVIGRNVAETEAAARQVAGTVIAVAAAGLVLLAVLCAALVRRGLRPLDGLVAVAGRVSAGDVSARANTVGAPAEVARVGAALDAALDSLTATADHLADANAATKRFVSDAAHELRTPVSVIAAFAELDRRHALEPAVRAEALRTVGEQAERLRRIVDELFTLAVLEEGAASATEIVDVGELARRAVIGLRERDPDRPIGLVVRGDDLTVRGNAFLIERAIDNLVRNVERHTPPGTPAELAVAEDGAHVVLAVRDEGPGIAAAALPTVFQRYRRANGMPAPGSGLGLSIVNAVAEMHGGAAEARTMVTGGCEVSVRFARASPPREGT